MSSSLETLIDRGVVQLLTANTPEGTPATVLVIANTQYIDGVLVLATPESVGNSVGSVGNPVANGVANAPESVGNE